MGKKIYISQQLFEKSFRTLAKLGVKVCGMTIVKHVKDSTPLDTLDGYSSPSEYWKNNYKEPISPSDRICTSCMKKRKSFVVGHVENAEKIKMWLYPVCDHCNKTYKNSKSEHLFYAYTDRLKAIKIR